jgi:hypothetical protein
MRREFTQDSRQITVGLRRRGASEDKRPGAEQHSPAARPPNLRFRHFFVQGAVLLVNCRVIRAEKRGNRT